MVSLVWAILGLVLIGSEFIVPEFVIFFFGLGALAMSLLTALLPGLGPQIPLQIVLWLAMSGVSLFALRRTFSRVFKGSLFDRSGDQDAGGQTARVTERITPDAPGRISYHGTTWKAISYDESIDAGETVEILKKEGMSFLVTRSMLDVFESDDQKPAPDDQPHDTE
ncbi:MAG: NfeD family protein [Spirochaetaceae bacterium]|nr:MAG: NfeD family protein [Spirochaetaceae bacterium]